jgi:hypothetical protein
VREDRSPRGIERESESGILRLFVVVVGGGMLRLVGRNVCAGEPVIIKSLRVR